MKKILIRAPNWLGDSVMSVPAVKGLKRFFPQAELWVLSRKNLSEFWRFIPEADGIIEDERGASSLKRQGFNLVILLTNSFGSALRMFRAGIPERRGYKVNARGWLLTQPVPFKRGLHQREYFLGLIDGLENVGMDNDYKIKVPLEIQNEARRFLSGYGWQYGQSVIGIHATSSYGPAKCWLPERFARLIEELRHVYDSWIFMCGTRQEREGIENILKGLSSRERIINGAGQTGITRLAAVISLCKAFIANDSGPMHLAGAVGVPVVGIFGSTDPNRTGPEGRAVVIKKNISCSPCFRRRCPKDMECMRLVKAEDVIQAVEGLV